MHPKLQLILSLALLLASFSSHAQTDLKTLKDCDWEVMSVNILGKSVNTVVKLDSHFTAALVGDEKQDWYPLTVARLKDKIIVMAAADKSYLKSNESAFNAFLVDPSNGKILLQKEVFAADGDFMQIPEFYSSSDGSFFKFSVRATKLKKKAVKGLNMFTAFTRLGSIDDQMGAIQDFTLFTIDDHLATVATKRELPEGSFVGSATNSNGDLFVMMLADKASLTAARFEGDNKAPATVIHQPLDTKISAAMLNNALLYQLRYSFSPADPLTLYWAVAIDAGKSTGLLLSRLNFSNKTADMVKELFTKDRLKGLEKNYKSVNKKVDKPRLGVADGLTVHRLEVYSDMELVTIGSVSVTGSSGSSSPDFDYRAEIIASFSPALKLNYLLPLPNDLRTKMPVPEFQRVILNRTGNTLRFVLNINDGLASLGTVYGEANAETGAITQLSPLSKAKIKNDTVTQQNAVIWSDKTFIVPYFDKKGFTSVRFDVSLKQYGY